jgi:predicted LPLAT superfamily acyltransferase
MSQASWSTLPERGSIWGIRSVLFALNMLGYRFASALLIPIAAYFFLTGGRSRIASLNYLRRLHRYNPGAPEATLWQSYLHHLEFAQTMLERLMIWQGRTHKFQFVTEGSELLQQKGRSGAVLLGAHLGSFDVLRALALGFENRVNVTMFRAHAPRINRVLRELNAGADLHVIELASGDLGGILELKDCIDRGEHVALLADRHAPGPKERSAHASFLGEPAPFPQSPWILASLLECPVHLVMAIRTGPRSYRVWVEPLAERIVLPKGKRETGVMPHAALLARRLEEVCCQYPRQWFNYYDFWNPHE